MLLLFPVRFSDWLGDGSRLPLVIFYPAANSEKLFQLVKDVPNTAKTYSRTICNAKGTSLFQNRQT